MHRGITTANVVLVFAASCVPCTSDSEPDGTKVGVVTDTPAPPKKDNKTLIIVLVVVAVLLLCCCCGVFGIPAIFGDVIQEIFEEIEYQLSAAPLYWPLI